MPTDTDLNPPAPPAAPGTGLINGARSAMAPSPAPAPAPAFSQGVQNKLGQWGMTEDDISTAKQVGKVLDPNSALMKQVQGQSDMEFNRRGLGNSSAAVEAGQGAMISKALEMVNPTIDRITGMATTDRNNDAAMAREQASISGQMSIASMNNAAALDRQKLGAESDLKLAGVNNTAALDRARLQTDADNARLDKQLAADSARTDKELAFRSAQSDKDFQNSVTLNKLNNEQQLQNSYRNSTSQTYDSYLRDVTQIQTSDMDPEVKAAQIKQLNQLYGQRQTYVNSIYEAAPGWKSDWSKISVEFGGSTGSASSSPADNIVAGHQGIRPEEFSKRTDQSEDDSLVWGPGKA